MNMAASDELIADIKDHANLGLSIPASLALALIARMPNNIGEPVAWQVYTNLIKPAGKWMVIDAIDKPEWERLGYPVRALYTHPAPVIPASPAVGDDDLIERLLYVAGWLARDCYATHAGTVSEAASRLAALQAENWQLKQALGYPIPADKETPQNPFKCGTCEASHMRAEAAEAREKVLREALEQIAETDSDGLVHTAGGMAAIAHAALSAHKEGA